MKLFNLFMRKESDLDRSLRLRMTEEAYKELKEDREFTKRVFKKIRKVFSPAEKEKALRAKLRKELEEEFGQEYNKDLRRVIASYETRLKNEKRQARIKAAEERDLFYNDQIAKFENQIFNYQMQIHESKNKPKESEHKEIIKKLEREHSSKIIALETQIKALQEKLDRKGTNPLPFFKFKNTEALDVKRTYKIGQGTADILQELKQTLYADNAEITLNELVNEAIRMYCYVRNNSKI